MRERIALILEYRVRKRMDGNKIEYKLIDIEEDGGKNYEQVEGASQICGWRIE